MRGDCCRLLQQLAFSELHDFSWDNFPANTMAYDSVIVAISDAIATNNFS